MADLKENIIKTSAKLFAKFGLRSVSIDDICSELHISKKTFYNYFQGKSELVEAVINYVLTYRTGRSLKERNAWSMVDVIMNNYTHFASHHTQFAKHIVFLYDLEKYYPELNQSFKERLRELDQQRISETIRRGVEEGVFRDDLNVEFTAAMVAATMPSVIEQKRDQLSTVKRMFFCTDIFLHIVCNERGLARYAELRAEIEAQEKTKSNKLITHI